MRFREWMANEATAGTGPDGGDGAASGDLDEVRRSGERLLRAGREAIERTLSGDSESFLRAVGQQGGQ